MNGGTGILILIAVFLLICEWCRRQNLRWDYRLDVGCLQYATTDVRKRFDLDQGRSGDYRRTQLRERIREYDAMAERLRNEFDAVKGDDAGFDAVAFALFDTRTACDELRGDMGARAWQIPDLESELERRIRNCATHKKWLRRESDEEQKAVANAREVIATIGRIVADDKETMKELEGLPIAVNDERLAAHLSASEERWKKKCSEARLAELRKSPRYGGGSGRYDNGNGYLGGAAACGGGAAAASCGGGSC